MHLLIAWLALQLSLGDASGAASGSGALHELAQQPFGKVLVVVVSAGLLLLVVWQLIEVTVGYRDEDGAERLRHRATSAGKAVLYAGLGWSGVEVARGSGGSGGGTRTWTARLLDLPAGQVLVGLVGLGVLVVGVVIVRKGVTGDVADDLDGAGRAGDSGTAYVALGRIGHVAKGVALALVGVLFGYAAVTHEADESGGLDAALREVLDQPFGPVLLSVLAVGLGCYGLFCLVRAAHLSR
ncbi:unannotated protein [freshwater metagenome]|uniref:Unannotated protein n=1 Tax=freshwater metagenome TaxID=449393 RepID=A0A6J6R8D5_9ZZZZ